MVKLQPLPPANVRARCQEVFACMSLMHAQRLHDAPAHVRVGYSAVFDDSLSVTVVCSPVLPCCVCCAQRAAQHARHRVFMCSSGLMQPRCGLGRRHVLCMQGVSFVAKCFGRLQLTHAQQVKLASVWQMWRRNRQAYDSRVSAALTSLAGLACTPPGACRARPDAPILDAPDAAMHAEAAYCLCAACARRLARRLLGVSVRAHSHAALALRRLHVFQDLDCAGVAAVVQAVCLPTVFLSPEQIAHQMQLSIEHRMPPPDWLLLCKMADEELKSRTAFESLALG